MRFHARSRAIRKLYSLLKKDFNSSHFTYPVSSFLRFKVITHRKSGQSIHRIIFNLNQYLRGWWNYYSISRCNSMFRSINGWIMRRLRANLWKQWKNPRTRVRELRKRGIYGRFAHSTGNARKGAWRMSRVKWVIIALPNRCFSHNLKLFLRGSPAQISRTTLVRDPYAGWFGRDGQ